MTTFLTAFAIVTGQRKGTLESASSPPVQPMGLLLGKILPYFAIGFIGAMHYPARLSTFFAADSRSGILLLLLPCLPCSFLLSFRTLISTKAGRSEAMQMALLTFLPSIVFSGYIFPGYHALPFYIISSVGRRVLHQHHPRNHLARTGLRHLWFDGLMLTIRRFAFLRGSAPVPEEGHRGVGLCAAVTRDPSRRPHMAEPAHDRSPGGFALNRDAALHRYGCASTALRSRAPRPLLAVNRHGRQLRVRFSQS